MIRLTQGKPGEGMQYQFHRNRAQWLSVADFLTRQNLRQVLQQRQSAAARGPACGDTSAAGEAAINFGGYGGAYPSSVPVGNTGTTSTGRGV